MLTRTMLAATALACVSAPALADAPAAPARCEETSFRVYFARGSAELDPTAADMLRAAARHLAACDYRELRIALDPYSSYSEQRGAVISAAAGAEWDTTRLEAREAARGVSHDVGPDYAEVVMTPSASTTQ